MMKFILGFLLVFLCTLGFFLNFSVILQVLAKNKKLTAVCLAAVVLTGFISFCVINFL